MRQIGRLHIKAACLDQEDWMNHLEMTGTTQTCLLVFVIGSLYDNMHMYISVYNRLCTLIGFHLSLIFAKLPHWSPTLLLESMHYLSQPRFLCSPEHINTESPKGAAFGLSILFDGTRFPTLLLSANSSEHPCMQWL